MTQKTDNSETYTVVVPSELAGDVEEYRDAQGLSKSAAGRELMEAGIQQHKRHTKFFEEAAMRMVSAAFAGVLGLLLMWLLFAVGLLGEAFGLNGYTTFAAAGLVAMIALVGQVLQWSGFFRWADSRVSEIETALTKRFRE